MDLFDELAIDDLRGRSRALADAIGIDAFKKLVIYAGGAALMIPTKENVVKGLRNRRILQEYSKYNVRSLSQKYGLTDRAVYKILSHADDDEDGDEQMRIV